jgi:hypothetical protein
MPNGQLVTKNENMTGNCAFPMKARGLYLVMIKCNGKIDKKMISYF